MNRARTVGVNDMLSFVNVIAFTLIFYALFFEQSIDENPYIDKLSLILGLLLCGQTQILLYLEKRNTDPFILVLTYVTTVYYSLRLFTLNLYPYSTVFDRVGEYGPADSNISLLIILVGNTCLAAGLFSKKLGLNALINVDNYKPIQPKLGTLIIIFIVSFNVLISLNNSENNVSLIGLIILFFSPVNIFIILATYVYIFRLDIKFFYKLSLIAIALILLAIQTIGGSRSGLLTYINYMFFFTIVFMPFFRIKLSAAIYAFSLIPVVLFLSIYIFVYATISRGETQTSGANMSVVQQLNVINEIAQSDQASSTLESMKGLMFARAGFFDFTSEIIAHRKIYGEIFTLESYFKSIIDNVLTPGFDIFDYPKIGLGISQVSRGVVPLSKKGTIDAYQSDQISLIAETFSLFGYISFVVLFLVGRFFKSIYSKSFNSSPFNLALKRVFLIIIFYSALLSFGLDWLLLDAIVLALTIIFFKPLFRIKRISNNDVSMA